MEPTDESGNSISSENLKKILDHIKVIIIKEDYEPLVKNCPLSSVGANKELGDLYIESFDWYNCTAIWKTPTKQARINKLCFWELIKYKILIK